MPRSPIRIVTVQSLGVSDVPPFDLTDDAQRELSRLLSIHECNPSQGTDTFRKGYIEACSRSVGEWQRCATNPPPSELQQKLRDAAKHAKSLRDSLTDLTDNLDGGTAAVALAPSLAHICADQLLVLDALADELAEASDRIKPQRGPRPQTYRHTLARDVTRLASENGLPTRIGDARTEGWYRKNFLCSLFSAALSTVEGEIARLNGTENPEPVPDDVRDFLRAAIDQKWTTPPVASPGDNHSI